MKKYYILSLLAIFFSLAGCKGGSTESEHDHSAHEETEMHHNDGHEATEAHDEHDGHNHDSHEESHNDEIVIDAHKAEEAGIVVSEVSMTEFNGIIKTTGEILPTRENEMTVIATVAGTINFKSALLEGSNVVANKDLFQINSSKIEGGDISEKARINYEIAKKEFDRVKALFDERIVSEREYNEARQTFEEARINFEAIGQNRGSDGQIVKAPMSGFVKTCLVKEGDFVQAGQPLMTIARDSHLYLKAELPERFYGELYNITGANFKTSYNNETYSLDDLEGKVVSRGKSSDGTSYYIPVTFSFKNTGTIVAGSFVEVFLKTTHKEKAMVLPLSAITEEQGSYFIYKQLDPSCYKKVEVTLGANDGINVQVFGNLTDGDKVVVKGAYQVKLASAVSSIPAHSHEH